MEKKHFSHIHDLGQQQIIPQGHEMICSGCKLEASGLVHGCWECNFFLHDQCFTASRALVHHSHPSHPLTLAPFPTYPSNTFFCNSCNLVGTGFAYSCSLCDFDIHVHCAYENNVHQNYVPNNSGSIPAYMNQNATPSGGTGETKHFTHAHALYLSDIREKQLKICSGCDENITAGPAYICKDNQCDFNLHKSCFDLPEEIRHNSHPNHPLTLTISPDQNNGFSCDGCHQNGFSFTYNCRICNFDLHTDCASLPKTVKRKDHEHPLTLYYGTNGEYICDACWETAGEGCWLYLCRKCDFGTHTYCVTSKAKPKPVVSNSQLDYYDESEKVMAALAAAKIRHKAHANCLSNI